MKSRPMRKQIFFKETREDELNFNLFPIHVELNTNIIKPVFLCRLNKGQIYFQARKNGYYVKVVFKLLV